MDTIPYVLDDIVRSYKKNTTEFLVKNRKEALQLYTVMKEHIETFKLKTVVVSLSGGVDSMVLLELLMNILPPASIVACHLNYKNRSESDDEQLFIEKYCCEKGIQICSHNMDLARGDIKRSEYEKYTRNIRFSFYRRLCEEFEADGVMLAHHIDDVVENVFNNIMRGGRSISDLRVLCAKNAILNVDIHRPFINCEKKDIYDFAHTFSIPYFKDTTPDWSCRGQMRRRIFPSLVDCYSEQYKTNILELSKEGEELGNIVKMYIIDDIIEGVYYENHMIGIPMKKCLCEMYILKAVLIQIFHKYNMDMMKTKNAKILAAHIQEGFRGKIKNTLLCNFEIMITDTYLMFHRI